MLVSRTIGLSVSMESLESEKLSTILTLPRTGAGMTVMFSLSW